MCEWNWLNLRKTSFQTHHEPTPKKIHHFTLYVRLSGRCIRTNLRGVILNKFLYGWRRHSSNVKLSDVLLSTNFQIDFWLHTFSTQQGFGCFIFDQCNEAINPRTSQFEGQGDCDSLNTRAMITLFHQRICTPPHLC